ncbi:MAG: carboxypeptidase regulatory-like domain-containing protein [Candidatus Aminicenantes bacterium]|nr:MAG: carboxypeptidase regulatory-like domain-containing protein [Candidatus Aminicenantes bacterium]
MGKKILLFLIAGLMIAGFAFSEASQTGTISGVVRTPEGSALPGVIVLLRSPAFDLPEIEAFTNASGMYGFAGLSPGTYELTFIFSGLKHVEQRGIVVSAGESVSLNIDLPLRAKDEAVVVEGDFPNESNQRITIHEINLRLLRRGLFALVLGSLFNQPNSLPL